MAVMVEPALIFALSAAEVPPLQVISGSVIEKMGL
jgi:hypothetical protein